MRARLIVYVVVLFEEPLKRLVTLDVVLLEPEDLEGLLLGHETTFDSQTLLGDGLTALVGEFFGLGLIVLFMDEAQNPLVSFRDRQWPDHLLKG